MPAVVDSDAEVHARIVLHQFFGMTHAPNQLGRQFIDASDEADAHIFLVHLSFFPIEILRKEPHKEIDLVMRPLPILR